MSTRILQFTNCKILRNHRIYIDDLWVRDGIIVDPEKTFYDEKLGPNRVIDLHETLVAPGFIDIQINGGFGVDFSHDVNIIEDGLQSVAKGILPHGVTAFCPTLVTSKPDVYHQVLPKIKKTKGGTHGAEILGVHVEGPFINKDKRGAHAVEDIMDFGKGFRTLDEVYGYLDDIKIVTLAPEKENSRCIIEELVNRGIAVSLGHSAADIKTAEDAVSCGASLITHLFNAMLPFHHRDPGIVGLLASNNVKKIYYGIIADGVHTHPAALRIAHRANPKGVVLVTDAISAMGLAEGVHHIGQKVIDVRGDCAYIANTDTLCGSVATMNKCVKYFLEAASCSTVEALEAASLHPAEALGLSKKKGSLNYGADADFVTLNDSLDVLSTWIAGECVSHVPEFDICD
ncbi:hypothetical protein AAG570_013245 [Ranatra chinensis]|uniref:N-acetylglucosamine-6-phosphate deacetylase n=1 Tax=Ranatra chinensis TaxID=642074 RepID=A0ABD0YGC2_9HEMI